MSRQQCSRSAAVPDTMNRRQGAGGCAETRLIYDLWRRHLTTARTKGSAGYQTPQGASSGFLEPTVWQVRAVWCQVRNP